MKNLARSILILLLAALSLYAQGGIQSFPFSASTPPSVANVNCFTVGTPGNTTVGQTGYYYWVVAIYPGGHIPPIGGAPSCFVPNANTTLSGSNYDTISWSAPAVPSATAVTYAVLRATNTTFPGTGTTAVTASTSSLTVNDQSNSLNSYTFVADSVANAQMILNNRDSTAPFIQLLDGNGGNTIQFYGPGNTYSVQATVTLAQVNAGFTLLPATVGVTYNVVGYWWKVNGAFATCTDVRLSDTSGGPVDVTTILIAALTNGAILGEQVTSSTTIGTFAAPLTANTGVQMRKTGSACTGNTNTTVRVLYKINS